MKNRSYDGCRWIATAIGVAVLALLLGLCLTQRVYITQNKQEQVVVQGLTAGFYMFLVVSTAVLLALCKALGRVSERTLFLVGTILYGIAGCYLIVNVEPELRADAQGVFTAALQFNAGDFSSLDKGNYMFSYPHQLGLMTLERLWLALGGVTTESESAAFGVRLLFAINLGYVILINFLLWQLSRLWFVKGEDRESLIPRYSILLSFLFLPQLFFILFVYGSLPGMACILAAAFFLTKWFRQGGEERSRLYFALTVVAAALAVMVRNNYMIGVLALMAATFLRLLQKRHLRDLALILCLALTLSAPMKLLRPCYEAITGAEIGEGMPMSLYAAMAMQEGNRGNGWYNSYSINTYVGADYDSEVADAQARDDIEAQLDEFRDDPAYAVRFYGEKVRSIWCDPTFQSIWSGPLDDMGQETHTLFLKEIYSAGPVYERIASFCQVVVIQILGFALAATVRLMGRKGKDEEVVAEQRPEVLFPVIFLVGGFLFHILWEAKSQYVFMYLVGLIPLAAFGITSGSGILWPVRGGQVQENEEISVSVLLAKGE
ncbi:MAG: hypothetical protein J6E42_05230 [Firmicutes bacterium]|nr:hypothetical protein [Bacillota bacterium]